MATIRLIPSTYYLSSSSYLSVSNASNMYSNTDDDNYATVTNSQTGTTSYYIYLRGFNFDDIPNNAIITDWTVKLKARETGVSTSSSYSPKLCNDTSQITSTCSAISTTVTTHEFAGVSADWEDIVGYGSNFGIRINCRRASRNTTAYMYIYGAEIEVTYTIPEPSVVTSSLTGEGTINPSGATSLNKGDEYEITITPTNKSDEVKVTLDGVEVTPVAHGVSASLSTVLGTYSLQSGSFNSGESWFEGIVGNGYDTTDTTSSNYYSGSSSTQAVFRYQTNFSNIPSNAVIERVYMMVNGHAESTSQSNEYMCVQLVSGSTEFSEKVNFKDYGTSNQTITVEATTLPTVSQLANLAIECTLGYYGGAINGATVFVEYSVSSGDPDHYTYSFITTASTHTIVVTIGSSTTLYRKVNGSWEEITFSKIFKKVNGSWVEQDPATAFDSNTNYVWS